MIEKFEIGSDLMGCKLYMEPLSVSDDEVVAHGIDLPEPAPEPDGERTEDPA
ncbi:hypothetical protein [Kitasatospora sp. NPDC048407]|uniref:hypothetical protein n=1 Tax=Kitasatospora sp. NPDC048407 TaxID=3364051 RepID=UPI003715D9F8